MIIQTVSLSLSLKKITYQINKNQRKIEESLRTVLGFSVRTKTLPLILLHKQETRFRSRACSLELIAESVIHSAVFFFSQQISEQ
jgi:hypothetical protein